MSTPDREETGLNDLENELIAARRERDALKAELDALKVEHAVGVLEQNSAVMNANGKYATNPNWRHEESGCETVARWVKAYKAKLEVDPNGGLFDSSMRCVTEGREVFYVDPEEIERLVDSDRACREALRLLHGQAKELTR